MQALV